MGLSFCRLEQGHWLRSLHTNRPLIDLEPQELCRIVSFIEYRRKGHIQPQVEIVLCKGIPCVVDAEIGPGGKSEFRHSDSSCAASLIFLCALQCLRMTETRNTVNPIPHDKGAGRLYGKEEGRPSDRTAVHTLTTAGTESDQSEPQSVFRARTGYPST